MSNHIIAIRDAIGKCWSDPKYIAIMDQIKELEHQKDRIFDKHLKEADMR